MTPELINTCLAVSGLGLPAALATAALFPVVRRWAMGGAALALAVYLTMSGLAGLPGAVVWLDGPLRDWTAVRSDLVGIAMLPLVSGVGAVLWRYSRVYLDQDPGWDRYSRAMLGTLAAVTGLLVTNHLLVLAACWTTTSLALHRLLTHFPKRQEAELAAHKKFLASRLADLCLLGTAGLLYAELGTFSLDQIDALAASTPQTHAAALLLVVCAALKSAQLPFHGWLTQVMEAPTPVSALLHAGVVNMAGAVLLRVTGLLEAAPAGAWALVVIGTTTAVIASLASKQQVSIKGTLAWSTMAQMGFMLLQIGLGAYPLALLHLVAHSLYKAHAFLSSGSTVERTQLARAVGPAAPATVRGWLTAAFGGLAIATLAAWMVGSDPSHDLSLLVFGPVVGIALAPLLLRAGAPDQMARATLAAALMATMYFGLHELLAAGLHPEAPSLAQAARLSLAGIGFAAGFGLQVWLDTVKSPASQEARFALASGLYLDAWFTRLTFQVWPPQLTPAPSPALQLIRTREIRR